MKTIEYGLVWTMLLAPGVGFEPTRGAGPTGWQGLSALQARSLPDFPPLALGDPGAFHKS